MKKILFFLLLFLFQVSFSFGICHDPKPRIQTKFTRCDAAFIGKVVSERDVIEKEDGQDFVSGKYFRFEINRLFRGPQQKFIEVYEDNDSGRMGLIKNFTYLILVEKDEKGRLHGWCDDAIVRSEEYFDKKVSEIEDVIKNIRDKVNGDILGYVGNTENEHDGVKGIHFVVTGGGKVYKVVSDKDGFFHVSVPAGHYKVEPAEPNWRIKPTAYCPDSPDDVDVRIAGGGELGFVATKLMKTK